MSWIIGKIIKEILKRVASDKILFSMMKNRIISFTEEKIKDSETKTDDEYLLPILDSLKESKSEDFSVDLMRAIIISLAAGSNAILYFMIDHIEEYILGSRSRLDDMLFLPPLGLLRVLLGKE